MPNLSVNLSGLGTINEDVILNGNVTAGGRVTGAGFSSSIRGTQAFPSYGWTDDTDNGMFLDTAANYVRISAGGVFALGAVSGIGIAPTNFQFGGSVNCSGGDVTIGTGRRLLLPDGSVGSPSLVFTNDTTSGYYRAGAGDTRFTSGGSDRHKFDGSSSCATGFFLMNGTAQINGGNFIIGSGRKLILDASTSTTDLPLQFNGDPNTGLRWISADNMGAVSGGSEYLIMGGGGITTTQIVNTGVLYQRETTAPAGVTDYAAIYAVVDGGSKTDLAVIFQTGAAQVFAQEP